MPKANPQITATLLHKINDKDNDISKLTALVTSSDKKCKNLLDTIAKLEAEVKESNTNLHQAELRIRSNHEADCAKTIELNAAYANLSRTTRHRNELAGQITRYLGQTPDLLRAFEEIATLQAQIVTERENFEDLQLEQQLERRQTAHNHLLATADLNARIEGETRKACVWKRRATFSRSCLLEAESVIANRTSHNARRPTLVNGCSQTLPESVANNQACISEFSFIDELPTSEMTSAVLASDVEPSATAASATSVSAPVAD